MANNYFDTTGLVTYAKKTKVLEMVFRQFDFEEINPGTAYVNVMSEDTDTTWDSFFENIKGLEDEEASAATLNASEDEDDNENVLRLGSLMAVTNKIGADGKKVLEWFTDQDYDDSVTLIAAFDLAMLLDDGHGIQSLNVESCWYCSRPRLFEFGGAGQYRTPRVNIVCNSSIASKIGERLDTALVSRDTIQAAEVLAGHTKSLVSGIKDTGLQDEVLNHLGAQLVADKKAVFNSGFDPKNNFFSTADALNQIYQQPSQMDALLAVVREKIVNGENGFAAEIVRRWAGSEEFC